MAERRMFAKTIIDSDAFLELPHGAQLLYFHLGIRADDDGFVNKPKSILRMTGCSEADLKQLEAGKFLICFDSGVVALRHWRVHNYIRNDRYKPTVYEKEKAALSQTESGTYTLAAPPGIPTAYQRDTQVRLGKARSDEASSDKASSNQVHLNQDHTAQGGDLESEAVFMPPTATDVMIYVKQKKYHVDPERFVQFYTANGWMEGGRPMTSWKRTVDLWQQRRW